MAAVAGMDTALAARPFHQVMFINNVLQNYAKKYAIVNSTPRFFSNYAMAVLCAYADRRYSDGVLPVCDLKNLTKCWGYSKPSS